MSWLFLLGLACQCLGPVTCCGCARPHWAHLRCDRPPWCHLLTLITHLLSCLSPCFREVGSRNRCLCFGLGGSVLFLYFCVVPVSMAWTSLASNCCVSFIISWSIVCPTSVISSPSLNCFTCRMPMLFSLSNMAASSNSSRESIRLS
jgi:ABC-type uncharacterized transport system YnjBCD permease subunit